MSMWQESENVFWFSLWICRCDMMTFIKFRPNRNHSEVILLSEAFLDDKFDRSVWARHVHDGRDQWIWPTTTSVKPFCENPFLVPLMWTPWFWFTIHPPKQKLCPIIILILPNSSEDRKDSIYQHYQHVHCKLIHLFPSFFPNLIYIPSFDNHRYDHHVSPFDIPKPYKRSVCFAGTEGGEESVPTRANEVSELNQLIGPGHGACEANQSSWSWSSSYLSI